MGPALALAGAGPRYRLPPRARAREGTPAPSDATGHRGLVAGTSYGKRVTDVSRARGEAGVTALTCSSSAGPPCGPGSGIYWACMMRPANGNCPFRFQQGLFQECVEIGFSTNLHRLSPFVVGEAATKLR
jgi:hypothetical protein